jgi:hypothetical protein
LRPAQLILNVTAAERGVEPVECAPITSAIACAGLHVYKVIEPSVINAGIAPGDIIVIDESEQAAAHPQPFSIVLVEVGEERTAPICATIPAGHQPSRSQPRQQPHG